MAMSWIWSETFWLPVGTSWEDLKPNGSVHYPQFYELKSSIAMGVALLALRLLLETFVFMPIGYYCGWMNGVLLSRMASYLNFGFVGKSKFKRVAETAWRFVYYLFIWLIGVYVLHDQPQWTSFDACWMNWPNHPIPAKVWWYYIVETGFYWSLLFSTFLFDVKRSDFWQMTLHHVVTIYLLSMSFAINFVRIGTLILISHDTADFLLELGKLCRYAQWDRRTTFVFVVFLLTWIATRLVYFPFWLLYPMVFKAPALIQKSYRWENLFQRPIIPRVFMAMLIILLVLHLFWTYLLFKIAYKSLNSGVDDIREDSDSEKGDEEEKKNGGAAERKKQK